MEIFRITSRNGLLFGGCLALVVGLAFCAVGLGWLVHAVTVNGKSQPTSSGDFLSLLLTLAAASVSAFFAWKLLWLTVYEIRFSEDGLVAINATLRQRRFPVRELREIERIVAKFTLEDDDARELVVRCEYGTFRVPYFGRIEELIERVHRANPMIVESGSWRS
jgi:hypothetical protein